MERLQVSSEVFEEQLHPPYRTLRKARSACVPGVMGLISVNLNGSTPREDHRTQEANQTWGTLEVPKGPRHMRPPPQGYAHSHTCWAEDSSQNCQQEVQGAAGMQGVTHTWLSSHSAASKLLVFL